MRIQILVLPLLLATLLAGCTGDDAKTADLQATPDGDQTTDAMPAMDSNETAGTTAPANGTVAANTPPVASLAATTVNGAAPLNVTFTLDGSDADGDNLTWSFDDGNGNTTEGTALPATVNATYLAGNWTATFTVTDGMNETSQTIDLTVAAPAAPVATAPFLDTHLVWDVGLTDLPGIVDYFTCIETPLNTFDHNFYVLEEGAGGRTFTATIDDFAGGADIVEWGFYAISADCLSDEGFAFEGAEGTGVLPENTGYILTFATGGFLLDMHLVID